VDAARKLTAAGAAELHSVPDAGSGRPIFTVDDVSHVTSRESVSRPRRVMALAGAVVFFGLWCAALLIVPALTRSFRAGRRTAAAH
jgi:hypothetical protein